MDFTYILFNTLIYWSMAFILSSFFSFWSILNMSLGGFMVIIAYTLRQLTYWWISLQFILVLTVLVWLYIALNRALYRYFPNPKQRDHVGLIITLWLNMLLENATSMLYWPNSVSLDMLHLTRPQLLIILVVFFFCIRYFFRQTMYWLSLKAISENNNLVRSLWVKSNIYTQIFFWFLFLLLVFLAWLILNQTWLKTWDGMFYLIKWIGIMILVWIDKKEYIFLWALLYVVAEYLLFIEIWLPIWYKETLILWIIVLMLLFKPEGLFTLRRRKI